MKCPKCGYNSFECYDVCIKCSHDLTSHKENHGLKPIVLQAETRTAMAAALTAKTPSAAAPESLSEQTDDLFSFDLPDEEPAKEEVKVDFFNFSEKAATPPSELFNAFSFDNDQTTDKNNSAEDAFSSLLEQTQHNSAAPDAAATTTPSPLTPNSSPGEFELNNFSWDDTPEIANPENKKPVDDFKSLFGEIDSAGKK